MVRLVGVRVHPGELLLLYVFQPLCDQARNTGHLGRRVANLQHPMGSVGHPSVTLAVARSAHRSGRRETAVPVYSGRRTRRAGHDREMVDVGQVIAGAALSRRT